jgi:hypothetical protein
VCCRRAAASWGMTAYGHGTSRYNQSIWRRSSRCCCCKLLPAGLLPAAAAARCCCRLQMDLEGLEVVLRLVGPIRAERRDVSWPLPRLLPTEAATHTLKLIPSGYGLMQVCVGACRWPAGGVLLCVSICTSGGGGGTGGLLLGMYCSGCGHVHARSLCASS